MKPHHEWYASSTKPGDRSGTAIYHIPGREPVEMKMGDEETAARIALMLDAAYEAGVRDDKREWARALRLMADQSSQEAPLTQEADDGTGSV